MQFQRHNQDYFLEYFVKLEDGEELFATLSAFCKKYKIAGGIISGIGAAKDIELAYFNQKTKKYESKRFNDQGYEVTGLNGNIAGEKLHIHTTIANKNYRVFGGHLSKLVVSPSLEILIRQSNELERESDKKTGLTLLKLKQNFEI